MLKPFEPSSSVTVVWHMDPAVKKYPDGYPDMAAKNPSCWREQLQLHENARPTEFVIGSIPPSDLCRIEDDARMSDPEKFRGQSLFWSCFLYGLRDIKHSGFKDVPKVVVNGIDYVDPDWIEKVFAGPLRGCAMFVGGVAWRWNTAGDDDVKNL